MFGLSLLMFLVSIALFFIALITPKSFEWLLSRKTNRKNLSLFFFSAIVLFIILLIVSVEDNSSYDIDIDQKVENIKNSDMVIKDTYVVIATVSIDAEDFDFMDKKEVNLWPSYEDRSEVLGVLFKNDEVDLLNIDKVNAYCEVKKGDLDGWLACGWIESFNNVVVDYRVLEQIDLINGKNHVSVLAWNMNSDTSNSALSSLAKLAKVETGGDVVDIYCSEDAHKANYSSSYLEKYPNSLDECYLGKF